MEKKDCGSAASACSTEKKDCGTGDACATEKAGCGSKKQCCPGTVIMGALAGGLVMFLWFWASWTMLPWHKASVMSFKSERLVASSLAAATTPAGTKELVDGIYVLPFVTDPKTGAVGPEAVTKPYAFVSVYKNGYSPNDAKDQMLKQALLCLFGGLLLTKFLKKTPSGCCPVGCSMALGLFVGAFAYLPNMIWFHFPAQYSLVGLADCVIAITLAGAVISKCILKLKGGCGDKSGGSCGSKKAGSCDDTKPAESCGEKKGGCCG